ncbi:unnamed protein product [Amaranthus hypochondriacus]
MDNVREIPHSNEVDRRPRKRPRISTEVRPHSSNAQSGLDRSSGSSRVHSKHPSHCVKGLVHKASPPWRYDDKDGHYIFEIGENLTPRCVSGQVLKCWDTKLRELVAIKITRSIKKFRDHAMKEIDVLEQLSRHYRHGNGCVQMRSWFDYRNHICIVFEMLGPSLSEFLQDSNHQPFPVDLVREIGRQLLEFLAFMHDLRLVHTDLKPENIVFISSEYVKKLDYKGTLIERKTLPKSCAIKVIDFGNTVKISQPHYYIVTTRSYRAPEVILGLGWSYPCDLWSVGCILVELCSGEVLFQTRENLEHLAMMEKVLGPFPEYLLRKADRHAQKHIRLWRLNWPEDDTSRESIDAVRKLPRLRKLVRQHVHRSAADLIDLLEGLLRYNPSLRITAGEALRHPFFTRSATGLES